MNDHVSTERISALAAAYEAGTDVEMTAQERTQFARDTAAALHELKQWRRREAAATKRWGVRLRDSTVEFVVSDNKEAHELAQLNPGSEVIRQLHLKWEPIKTAALAEGISDE